jgi:hypothetical protein
MDSPNDRSAALQARRDSLLNWLALAALLALGIVAEPAPAAAAAPQNALRPVSVRPMVSWWMVSVPS